jgi:hypothetical protein
VTRLLIGLVVALGLSLGMAAYAEAFKIPCNPTCQYFVFCC